MFGPSGTVSLSHFVPASRTESCCLPSYTAPFLTWGIFKSIQAQLFHYTKCIPHSRAYSATSTRSAPFYHQWRIPARAAILFALHCTSLVLSLSEPSIHICFWVNVLWLEHQLSHSISGIMLLTQFQFTEDTGQFSPTGGPRRDRTQTNIGTSLMPRFINPKVDRKISIETGKENKNNHT